MFFKSILLVSTFAASLAYADSNIWIDDWYGQIGIVDVVTGSATVIGNSGVILTDIAFDPNGNLFGVTFDALYSINKANGKATLIGSLGVSDINSLVFSPNGVLYASGNTTGNLYTINPTTGKATVVFNTGYSSGGDLAFLNGNLYYTDALNLLIIEFNIANNTTKLIGPIGWYPFFGLVAASNGVLYGVASNSVYSINTATGAGTLVTTYANGLGGANGAALYTGANDCLFNWAEKNYSNLFSPAGSSSMFFSSYNYRYYPSTDTYLGVSSDDDNVYYMGSDSRLQNEGSSSYWLPKASCKITPSPQVECLFNWAEKNYPALFSPAGNSTLVSSNYTYYRSYSATNGLLGVSSTNNHVYYKIGNGSVQDVGPLSNWLPQTSCQ